MAEGENNQSSVDLPLAVSYPTPDGYPAPSSSKQPPISAKSNPGFEQDQSNVPKTIVGVGSSFLKMFVGNAGEMMFLPRGYTMDPDKLPDTWICITAPSGSVYQVWMERYLDSLVLRSGWSDIMDRDGVDQGDIGLFTRTGSLSFSLTIMTRGGMQKAPVCHKGEPNGMIRPAKVVKWQDVKFYHNKGVKRSEKLVGTLYSIWAGSKHPFILYATHMVQSAVSNGTIILSRDVSAKLPAGPVRLGLVFDGSRLIYEGSMVKREDGSARITGGWIDFVRANDIRQGSLYVFKFEVCQQGWQVTLYQV